MPEKDFFISYTSADREWAEWIAWQLEDAGYSTVLQVWDFLPGSNFVLEMDKATQEAQQTIAVLSPDYLNALYTQPEWAAAFVQDPTGKNRVLLPVRIHKFKPRGLLSSIVYIDLVGLDDKSAREKLLTEVRKRRRRAKPDIPPAFPQTRDSDQDMPEDILDGTFARELLGPAVRIVEFSRIIPASDEEVQQYYKGAPLTWKIIASRGDVERDQASTLIKNCLIASNRTNMLCLSGEPGAGKSTLAWRIAAEVAQTTQRPLLHILDNEAGEIWYKIEETFQQYGASLIILVDDVFRDYNARRALASLDSDLNITIIASSRSNEIPDDLRLPFPLHLAELSAPTANEQSHVLKRLGLEERTLKAVQRKSLQKANSWLVMMMEITTREELAKIVRDSIKRLKQQDEVVYEAYEYLCFAGQYDLVIPETLIAALDHRGRFYNLLEHPASKGFIFSVSTTRVILRALHSTIAREALKSYRRAPLALVKEFVNAIQPGEIEHRIFLCLLLINSLSLNREKIFVRQVLEQQATRIDTILTASGAGELLYYWAVLYRLLGDRMKVKELEGIVLNKIPEIFIDWSAQFRLLRRGGTPEQIARVIDAAADWLTSHPEDHTLRQMYLGLVEWRGTPEQLATGIETTTSWLSEHPENANVRGRYLGLVERKGTTKQIVKAIDTTTTSWLAEHPEDANVRAAYVGLVERKGTPEQIATVIDTTTSWLAEHPEDHDVRRTYLGLVERRGTVERIASMISSTTSWLAEHPEDATVRERYLGLVERRGTVERITTVIDTTTIWLADHSEDIPVRERYLGLVERRGTAEQITTVIDTTTIWLAEHPEDTNVRKAYVGLVERKGTTEQIATVIDTTSSWLADHAEDIEVRRTYLGLVERKGTIERITTVLDTTTSWLAEHPEDANVRERYLGLVERRGTTEQIATVLDTTTGWLSDHPENHDVRRTYLGLVERKGTEEQIATVIDTTTGWLADNPEDIEVRKVYLGLVERKGTPEQIEQAYHLAKNWFDRSSTTRDTRMLEGYGRILFKLARYQEAEAQFRRILELKRSYVRARFDLGWSLYYQGKKREAYSEFQHARWWAYKRNQYPIGGALNQLGSYHFLEGDFEQAVRYFQEAILTNPDFYSTYRELGRARLAQGKYNLALKSFEEALKRLPTDVNEKSRAELEELKTLTLEKMQDNQSY